jgi:hypothetical protein
VKARLDTTRDDLKQAKAKHAGLVKLVSFYQKSDKEAAAVAEAQSDASAKTYGCCLFVCCCFGWLIGVGVVCLS